MAFLIHILSWLTLTVSIPHIFAFYIHKHLYQISGIQRANVDVNKFMLNKNGLSIGVVIPAVENSFSCANLGTWSKRNMQAFLQILQEEFLM